MQHAPCKKHLQHGCYSLLFACIVIYLRSVTAPSTAISQRDILGSTKSASGNLALSVPWYAAAWQPQNREDRGTGSSATCEGMQSAASVGKIGALAFHFEPIVVLGCFGGGGLGGVLHAARTDLQSTTDQKQPARTAQAWAYYLARMPTAVCLSIVKQSKTSCVDAFRNRHCLTTHRAFCNKK